MLIASVWTDREDSGVVLDCTGTEEQVARSDHPSGAETPMTERPTEFSAFCEHIPNAETAA